MPRPERAVDPAGGPIAEFAVALRRLRATVGNPGYRELARRAHYSATTLSDAAGGKTLPTLAVAVAYATACGGDRAEWQARWQAAAAHLAAEQLAAEQLAAERPVGGAPEPTGHRSDDPGRQPYRGLAAYQPSDAEWFFGRETLVTDLIARLRQRRLLAVFGPSGAGKSSLLRAGLIPAVQAESWPRLLMTPGRHPLDELAAKLSGLATQLSGAAAPAAGGPLGPTATELRADPGTGHLAVTLALRDQPPQTELLLVVDQFEEIFTAVADPAGRTAFFAALLGLVDRADSRVRLVLGVRADFYAACAAHPELVAALDQAQVLVGPMSGRELRDAICRPAERAGLLVEGSLVSTIIAAVADRPGALPLVSHALLETWRRRRGAAVTLAAYQSCGGLDGAISNTAEDIYASLDGGQRDALRTALLRMIDIQADGTTTVRRAARAEFDDDPTTRALLGRLASRRLVVLGNQTVEIAHEALLRAWPRLRDWLDEDLAGLRIHRQLSQAVQIWESLNRDAGTLYRGAQLAAAAAWAGGAHPPVLTERERRFLDASRHAQLRDATARRVRIRSAIASLCATVLALSVLTGVALAQAHRAATERDVALARQLIGNARSQLPLDPEYALLLARRAYQTLPAPETESVLRQAVAESRINASIGTLDPVTDLAVSPDGRRLASSESGLDSGTVRVRGFPSGQPTTLRTRIALSVAFSPDGNRLATAGVDLLANAVAPIMEAVPVVEIAALSGRTGPVRLSSGTEGLISDLAFGPDGRWVAGAGDGGQVWLWDALGGAPARLLGRHDGRVNSVAVSPDGRAVVSGGADGTIRLWYLGPAGSGPAGSEPTGSGPAGPSGAHVLGQGTEAGRPAGPVRAVAFSPDGQTVLSGGDDGIVRLWPVTGSGRATLFPAGSPVLAVQASPDGRRIAAAAANGAVLLWDTAGPANPIVLRGHQDAARAVSFSPDGRSLVSGGDDRTIRVWDTGGRAKPMVQADQRTVEGPVWLTRDGAYAAVPSSDGIQVLSTRGEPPARVPAGGMAAPLRSVTVSADGGYVASVDERGLVWLSDPTGRRAPVAYHCDDRDSTNWRIRFSDQATQVVISPDGRKLAASCTHHMVRVWSVTDEHPPLLLPDAGGPLAFSPDGRTLATGSVDQPGSVRLWRTGAQARPRTLPGAGAQLNDLAFDSSAARLAIASNDGSVWIDRVDRAGDPIVLSGHPGSAGKVAFSRDGRQVASLGGDGTIRVWDRRGGVEPLVFAPYGPAYTAVAFVPDGERLVTIHTDGTVRTWRCEACGPIEQVLELADQRVTRSLTAAELAGR